MSSNVGGIGARGSSSPPERVSLPRGSSSPPASSDTSARSPAMVGAASAAQSKTLAGSLVAGALSPVGLAVMAVSSAAGAWHGYRRNGSVGWALAWAAFGAAAPVLSTVIAAAQGFGRRKGRA